MRMTHRVDEGMVEELSFKMCCTDYHKKQEDDNSPKKLHRLWDFDRSAQTEENTLDLNLMYEDNTEHRGCHYSHY